jgi:hypothetical protein
MQDHPRRWPLLALAFFCGAVPLLTGTAIFILWCVTGWSGLEAAGLLNIVVGLAFFLAGGGFLVGHFVEASWQRPFAWRPWVAGLAAGAVLVFNFPACWAIIDAVARIQDAKWATDRADALVRQSSLRVINTSPLPAESVRVTGVPNGTLGAIPPGGGASLLFEPADDKPLTVAVSHGGTSRDVSIPSPRRGGTVDVAVVIQGDGSLHVVPFGRRINALAD